MNEPVDWALVARFLAGETTPEESARVEAWRSASGDNENLFREARRAWEAAGEDRLDLDVSEAWRRLDEKRNRRAEGRPVRRRPAHEHIVPSRPAVARVRAANRRRTRRRRTSYWWVFLAGSAAALLALAVIFNPLGTELSIPAPSEDKVFVTRHGQRATIELTDGSRVRLNADSKLSLSSEFGSERREVFLEGEAQFDVITDADHSFIVQTAGATVEAVGTVFSVAAYEDDADTEVIVSEGAVVLRPSGAGAVGDSVVLRPNHMGTASAGRVHAYRVGVNLDRYLGWTEGRLTFSDTEFDKVALRLERWYDIDVELEVPYDSVDRLNATFEHEPLDQVLNDISIVLDVRYRKEGDAVTFFR